MPPTSLAPAGGSNSSAPPAPDDDFRTLLSALYHSPRSVYRTLSNSRHRRSTLAVGFLAGVLLSLSSVTTVVLFAKWRARRERRMKRRLRSSRAAIMAARRGGNGEKLPREEREAQSWGDWARSFWRGKDAKKGRRKRRHSRKRAKTTAAAAAAAEEAASDAASSSSANSTRGDDDLDDADFEESESEWERQEAEALRGQNIIELRSGEIVEGVEGLIGNTPLVRLKRLSHLTGCEILGKAEFLNPGGSPKDRVTLRILNDAEKQGWLKPRTGSRVFEGTVGSTGISLATLARAKGYDCSIVIPDDVAREKVELLRKLGADVLSVRPRGIVDPRHFVNEARAMAERFGKAELVGPHAIAPVGSQLKDDQEGNENRRDDVVVSVTGGPLPSPASEQQRGVAAIPRELDNAPRGFFADQFENPSNFLAHYEGTGPEIWRQTGGIVDAFVAGAGTGGTLAGVAVYLKERVERERARARRARRRMGFGAHLFRGLRDDDEDRLDMAATDFGDGEDESDEEEHRGFGLGWEWARKGLGMDKVERRQVRIVLADPQGSGLFNKVKYNVLYSSTEAEGTRRRHQVDTVVEGIGLNRLTHNFAMGLDAIDDAERVTDEEAVRMSRWLVRNEGLFLGSSSAVNVVAAVRTALKLKRERRKTHNRSSSWLSSGASSAAPPPVVVTILCDGGARHLSKFHNDEAMRSSGLLKGDDAEDANIDDILGFEGEDEGEEE